MKIIVKRKEDPKPTPKELAAANQFAKTFAARKGLISGEDTHVGDTIPKFVDEKGNEISQINVPKPNVKVSTFVPPEVNELLEDNTGLPYFIHPQTGDVVHVPQDYRALPRFNPNRGKPAPTNLLAVNIKPNSLIQ